MRSLAMGVVALAMGGCSGEPLHMTPKPPPVQNTPDAGMTTVADTGVDATPDAGMMPPSPVERLDLGPFTASGGETEEIVFDLPAGMVSFMVLLSSPRDGLLIIKTLEGPGGTLVSDDRSNVTQIEELILGPFAAQFKSPNRVIQDVTPAAALFPNNPMVQVSGGTYRMVATGLRGQSPFEGDISVTILYRTELPQRGALDVSLYFTGAGQIDAASAPTSALIQDALIELSDIYAQANVSIGDVRYHDADERFRTIAISLDGGEGALEEMFSGAEDTPGLHFFFVDRFDGGFPGAQIGGIAGGLPGPPRGPGKANAGVAVALSLANGDPGVLAHVMAHEGGHWLGLFHTSEITGTDDQLPDTPSGMAGDTFLMYPAVGGGTTISEAQGAVLRSHVETEGY